MPHWTGMWLSRNIPMHSPIRATSCWVGACLRPSCFLLQLPIVIPILLGINHVNEVIRAMLTLFLLLQFHEFELCLWVESLAQASAHGAVLSSKARDGLWAWHPLENNIKLKESLMFLLKTDYTTEHQCPIFVHAEFWIVLARLQGWWGTSKRKSVGGH